MTITHTDSRSHENIEVGENAAAVFGDYNKNTTIYVDFSTKTVRRSNTGISGSNTADEKGAALLIAAQEGDPEAVELFLKSGANFKYTEHDEQTALFKAVAQGHAAVVDILLADTDRRVYLCNKAERQWNDTPLHKAAHSGRTLMVKKLLFSGAPIEKLQRDNCSPLMLAAAQGHDQIVSLLLQRGANHFSENIHHGIPLIVAARQGRLQVIKVLLNHDATQKHLEHRNDWGDTALFVAVLAKHEDCARELISCGANVHVKNNDRNSLLHMACVNAMPHMLEFLLPKFANLEIQDKNKFGDTPLDIALKNSRQRCVALLRERLR